MALRWILHSACNVLGYQNDNRIQCNDVLYSEEVDRKMKSLKIPSSNGGFQMPLHYPRYKKGDYEKMEDWKIDMLLREYGLSFNGSLDQKRAYAMGAFLWPDQY